MRRFGVINQIVLILMCILLAVVVGALSFNRWQQAHFKPAVLKRASHMAQAAGIMDTVLRAKPEDLSTILRAVSGHIMRADIVTQVPPLPDGLTLAPHVTAKVRSLMAMPAPGLETYTDGVQWGLAYKNEDLEGVLRRAGRAPQALAGSPDDVSEIGRLMPRSTICRSA